jgi:GAF domain-containing protein
MSWLIAVFLTNTLSALILVVAYLTIWSASRRPSAGLWGIGWTAYTVRFLILIGESVSTTPAPWRFGSLATLGLSGFFLWAGTRSLIGRPLPLRAYTWGLLPVAWASMALVPFAVDYRVVAIPGFVFSVLVDCLTALALLRYSHTMGRRGAWSLPTAYIVWAALKIGHLFTPANSTLFTASLLLTNGLAFGMAFSLIGLSLSEAERHAQRRADRLNALAALTGAAGQLRSPEELLAAALEEVQRLLQAGGGLGAVLVEHEGLEGHPRLVAALDLCPGCPLRRAEPPATECLCEQAIASGHLVRAQKPEQPDTPGCRATIAIPLRAQQQTLGAVCATLTSEQLLSEGEQQTLETLGRQLGIALENARLVRAMDREVKRLQALTDASRHMIVEMDLQAAMAGIIEAARNTLGVNRAAVFLVNPDTGQIEVAHAEGLSPEYLAFATTRFPRTPAHTPTEESQMMWLDDAQNASEMPSLQQASRQEGFRSVVMLPLSHRKGLLGTLTFYYDEVRPYESDDQRFCRGLADQAAMMIENTLLHREMQRRLEELAALHEIDLRITSALELDEVLHTIAEQLRQMFGVSTLYIGLYDEQQNQLRVPLIMEQGEVQPPALLRLSDEEGLASWVIRTRQPVWVNDLTEEREGLPVGPIQIGGLTRSLAIVPLLVKEHPVGVLSVQSYEPRTFTAADRRLLTDIALHAAVAIHNARLYQAEKEARDLAERLRETTLLVSSSLDLQEVLELILDQLAHVLPYDSGTIQILERGRTRTIALRGLPPAEIGRCYPLDEYPYNRRLAAGEGPIVVEDVHQHPEWVLIEGLEHVRSNIGVPLWVRGRGIGLLTIDSRHPNAYDEADAAVVQTFAQQAAVAIENAQLYTEQRRRAEEAHVLLEIATAINSTLELSDILREVALRAARACEASRCSIFLLDEQEERLMPFTSQFSHGRADPESWQQFRESARRHRLEELPEAREAISKRSPLFIPDARASSLPPHWVRLFDVGSLLLVPLVSRDRVIGLLGLDCPERGRTYTAGQVSFAMTMAGQAALAIEKAHLYQREQQRRREAETLYRATQALTTTLDQWEVLDRILTELQQVVPYDSSSVQLIHDARAEIISGRGFPNLEELRGLSFDLTRDDNPNSQVVRSRSPLILDDAPTAYGEFLSEPHLQVGTRSWMGVPLIFGDRMIGLLVLDKREPAFYTPEHARLALAFAGQAAIAIENARLYRQLEEQSAELSRAFQELSELDRLRGEVIQNVNHELRTPLTLIQGYADLLLSGDLGQLSMKQRSALEVVYDRTITLAQLVHNLTALRLLSGESVASAPLQIQDVVRHCVAMYSRPASRVGIKVETDLPERLPPILGSRDQLTLVFSQLLDNAIKFSPDGGTIRVHAWHNDHQVQVAVRDEGIGIAPGHLHRIFGRFYQVDGSTTRRFSGLGIGLALVWEIVEAHGGSVTVESAPAKGSTFTVILPATEN